ncbi:LysE family translocator [Desulfolithobacter sp.]
MEYFNEFLTVALVHLLAVASPGPDFAMVLRQSLVAGRQAALWTSVGIGTGILIHVAYALMGLGLIISRSIELFSIIKLAGGAYLLYVGWKSLRSRPDAPATNQAVPGQTREYTAWQAFRTGFLTNVLNPKATLFFLSLFSVIIKPETPHGIQLFYGLYMALATATWFCGLSMVLTQARIRRGAIRFGHWTEKVMGWVLIGLGIRLALASRF